MDLEVKNPRVRRVAGRRGDGRPGPASRRSPAATCGSWCASGCWTDWRQLLTIPADDVTASDVVSFSADGRWLLGITPLDANAARLVRIDVASGAMEVLAEDPEADVDGVVLHPDTGSPRSSRS